jgi:hypothetical protein
VRGHFGPGTAHDRRLGGPTEPQGDGGPRRARRERGPGAQRRPARGRDLARLPAPSWHNNLQSCVVRLRKVLGTAAIETSGRGYRLGLTPDAVDTRRFETLALRGRALLALDEPERAAYTLSQALALWRGRPLAEVEEWEPRRIEAAPLAELRLDAQEWWLGRAPGRSPSRRRGAGPGPDGCLPDAGAAQGPARASAVPQRTPERRAGTLLRVQRRMLNDLGLDRSRDRRARGGDPQAGPGARRRDRPRADQ